MPDPLNLRSLVREVIDASTLDSPQAIAAEVARRVPAKDRHAALEQALRAFVRQVISEERGHHRFGYVSPEPTFAGSSKVGAIRDGWQRALRVVKVPTSSDPGAWKALGACTFDDLVYAAEQRDEQARRNSAKARQYRALAATVQEHGAATVADLPAEVLMVAVGQVAA